MFGWFGRWLVILGFWEDKVSLGRTGDIAVPNDRVRAYYEGEVDTADYWDPDNMGDCDIVVLLPHGFGKLTYRVEGEVLETYEGQFFMGEYSGEGKMVRLGKEYVGKFEKHRFVD